MTALNEESPSTLVKGCLNEVEVYCVLAATLVNVASIGQRIFCLDTLFFLTHYSLSLHRLFQDEILLCRSRYCAHH